MGNGFAGKLVLLQFAVLPQDVNVSHEIWLCLPPCKKWCGMENYANQPWHMPFTCRLRSIPEWGRKTKLAMVTFVIPNNSTFYAAEMWKCNRLFARCFSSQKPVLLFFQRLSQFILLHSWHLPWLLLYPSSKKSQQLPELSRGSRAPQQCWCFCWAMDCFIHLLISSWRLVVSTLTNYCAQFNQF